MWKTFVACAVVVAGSAFGLSPTAQAQGPIAPRPVGPAIPPPFSPYLNLLRRENPTYLNYYGLVRPQQEVRQSILGLRQGVTANQAAIQATAGGAMLPTTGHRSYFMNTTGYFMSIGGRGTGAGRAGVGMVRPAPPPPGGAVATPRPAGGGQR